MTKQEYIDSRNLTRISRAATTLKGLNLENSGVIKADDYQIVMGILAKWQDQLYGQ